MEQQNNKTPEKSEIRKENQDFQNMPSSSQKNETGETMKKQVEKTSEINEEGKTDNTEKNSDQAVFLV